MTVSIGAFTFDDALEQLDWVDKYQSNLIGQQVRRALTGNVHFYEKSIRGRLITLEARPDICWLRDTTVSSLISLANTVGAVYTFDWNGEIHSVKFYNAEGPAVDVTPISYATSYREASIKLIEYN